VEPIRRLKALAARARLRPDPRPRTRWSGRPLTAKAGRAVRPDRGPWRLADRVRIGVLTPLLEHRARTAQHRDARRAAGGQPACRPAAGHGDHFGRTRRWRSSTRGRFLAAADLLRRCPGGRAAVERDVRRLARAGRRTKRALRPPLTAATGISRQHLDAGAGGGTAADRPSRPWRWPARTPMDVQQRIAEGFSPRPRADHPAGPQPSGCR